MSNVYIVNKSAHDFSCARKYGKLIFLSEGPINRYDVNNMYRQFIEKLKYSDPDDYIVPCALGIMNSIACATFANIHSRLNLLLYKDKKYIERNLILFI